MDMRQRAEQQGWGRHNSASAEFRMTFDAMQAAIDGLPSFLAERGRELEFPQLHSACLLVDMDLICALLDAGIAADTYPCTEDEDDEPALVWLARDEVMGTDDKIRAATLLLDRGADINEGGALNYAREAGDDRFAAFLLSRGASECD